MELAIGILTVFLVLDALFLVLLILLQLPKKEAGLGTAFGGGTTDALFGAGAGNVLTKLTTWGAVFFLVAALVLSIMHKNAGDKRRNLGLTTTNSAPTDLQESTKKKGDGPIKDFPSAATNNGNTTKPTPEDITTSPPAPKKETGKGKAPKPKTPPTTPKIKTGEAPKPKTPPAKTKKSSKDAPPAKSKKAPPAKK